MKQDKKIILKVLVGSRAHGLADKNSDYDYRAVYILPTSKILSLGYKYKGNDWIEGKNDNTSYEIGHFLSLAIKCNPSVLEVFKAPIVYDDAYKKNGGDGIKLRNLFPYVWNPKDAFNAFIGYGLNQRKKFLDKRDNRQNKYAIAYIRTLYNLIELLKKKDFDLTISNKRLKKLLYKWKRGNYTIGEVIDLAESYLLIAKTRLEYCKHKSNLDKVNKFLIDIRRKYW